MSPPVDYLRSHTGEFGVKDSHNRLYLVVSVGMACHDHQKSSCPALQGLRLVLPSFGKARARMRRGDEAIMLRGAGYRV